MDSENLRELLDRFRRGEIGADDILARVRHAPIAELGFAQVDLNRALRCGFPEVIFSPGKTPEWIAGVMQRLIAAGQDCLVTRLTPPQAEYLTPRFPDAEYNAVARTIWQPAVERLEPSGHVLVITAGTSDLPVAEEAVVTARAIGCLVELIADVGVAGVHRLLRHVERFSAADAIVVVAGMEGALASVVGGLVDCPVIAVPTSIGYGAHQGGLTTLHAMLSSCASNVAAVNIDAGFNGGYVAALIARRVGRARQRVAQP